MKKRKKLTPSEAAKVFESLSAREQAAAEAYLRTPAGEAERQARNAEMLARLRKKNPQKRGKLTGAAKAAFLARMAKGRKKRGRAAPKLARNPARVSVSYKITAKGRGPKMHYDGERFSQRSKVKAYATAKAAHSAARALLRKYPVLRRYTIAIEPHF